MRFIVGSVCVLLGLFVVGGAHPVEPGPSSVAASPLSAGSQPKILSLDEIHHLTYSITEYNTFIMVDGEIPAAYLSRRTDFTGRPNIWSDKGLWLKIQLLPAEQWPERNQYPTVSAASLSATPYMQSRILLLLKQSGLLSEQILRVDQACVYFTHNFNNVWAWVPKTYGFGALVSIISDKDQSLASFQVQIDPAKDNTYPTGELTRTSKKRVAGLKNLEHFVDKELPALAETSSKDLLRECRKYQTAVFSEAEAHNKQLIVAPIKEEPLSIKQETP
ncbi:hypothetical protein F5878DRAFT_658694 [Lentinula raphanica]|uniref:Uncharacterized protein n=1 Tax=Lentinula raphanica TaxID=153919 RepID=A0AA38PEK4_9AGAR|nr:hypothetical protein F5878DRAFT_658694 [Lentinula raphanica]